MIQVKEDETVVSKVLVRDILEKKCKKEFLCPECKTEIAFYFTSPLNCPVCKKGIVDVEKLIDTGSSSLRVRRFVTGKDW
jgi:hypothetical protein